MDIQQKAIILLADSGSTKVSWRLIRDGRLSESFETAGINAALYDEVRIRDIVAGEVAPRVGDVGEISFFGAGVLPGEPVDKLRRVFGIFWPEATMNFDSDIVVAAKALFGSERGVACILGTGSNSCLWSGSAVERNIYAGGYILGDEGSGNWIGRALLSDFAKEIMPEDLRSEFVKRYGLDYFSLVKELYGNPAPGRYLSTFALFATEWKDHPYIYSTVRRGFELFLERNAARYGVARVGFVGSVAAVFEKPLRDACQSMGLRVTKIVRGPIDELVKQYLR